MTSLHCDVDIAFPGFALDVDCALPLEGVTALFGASGSGKSTLLRIIAGLEKRARGVVRFGEEIWQDGNGRRVRPHRRGIGYVFQEARLFAHLSVRGNLRYAARRANDGVAIHFDDVVDALDLAPLMSRRTTELSGGERQRVALGRALLARPRLILMDEPLASLDEKRKGDILPYIERLPRVFRVPTIYVTHNIAEVTRLADRMLLLSEGRVAAEGPIADVLARLDLAPETGRFEAGAGTDRHRNRPRRRLSSYRFGPRRTADRGPPRGLGPRRASSRARARPRRDAGDPAPLGHQRAQRAARDDQRDCGRAGHRLCETLVDIGAASLSARITRKTVAELGLAPGAPVYAIVKAVTFDRKSLASAGA